VVRLPVHDTRPFFNSDEKRKGVLIAKSSESDRHTEYTIMRNVKSNNDNIEKKTIKKHKTEASEAKSHSNLPEIS